VPTLADDDALLNSGGGGGASECGYDWKPAAIGFGVSTGVFISTTLIAGAILMGATMWTMAPPSMKPGPQGLPGVNEATETADIAI
jgi:hypothetical protein